MNEKNTKNKKNDVKMSAEDIQLYRLFCIFGVAILGFAALRMISYGTFFEILGVGRWIALALLVLTIGGYIYLRFVKKIDESDKVITTTGIAYFLIPIFTLLACFRAMEQPMFKCQVAFGFVALFATIYNIYKKEFKTISAVTFVSLMALYYASTPLYTWLEKTLNVVSKGIIFVLPIVMILLSLPAIRAKLGLQDVSDKFNTWISIIMYAVILVCALVVTLVPALFLYMMIALLAIYVVVGIVCTIRLI